MSTFDVSSSDKSVSYYGNTIESLLDTYYTCEDRMQAEFAASGIVRILVDESIQKPDSNDKIAACLWATNLLLHTDDPIEQPIPDSVDHKLSAKPGSHLDHVSYLSIVDVDHAETADRLLEDIADDDILLLAIAHGGVIPGARVFNALCDKTGSTKSLMYPIRFSREKQNDSRPRISDLEAEYLREQAKSKAVVLIDDDYFSRNTIEFAASFFSRLLETDTQYAVGYSAHRRQPNLITGRIKR